MSWLRSAVNKAVEVGKENNLTRAVKNYADSVVHHAGQAVAGGAKLFQDRVGGRNLRSFKQTVKRLEEASVSCRGRERVELMRRWLSILREIDKPFGITFQDKEKKVEKQQVLEEQKEVLGKQPLVLYYDADMGGEPLTFRDVFLYSQALEGISICMILEPPNEDEVSLLLELFRLCLTGGKEVHNAVVSSIQDLAKVFSTYQDEVLVKREELLQFAEGAITGLKVNADIERIDAEVSTLKKNLEDLRASDNHVHKGHETTIMHSTSPQLEVFKEALAHIRLCSRVEGLLLKKKSITRGDTAEIHSQKVDKLKVLSESLASSSLKAEKRISDNRTQREDALKFRAGKANELGEIERELSTEITDLEEQKDKLEAELKKVNTALSAAQARLHNVRDEMNQFFEANDQVVAHLKDKEDELARSTGSCRVEASVLDTWTNFLEDTWSIQRSYVERREKEAEAELERHEEYFTNFVTGVLSSYEKELRPSIDRIQKYVSNLKSLHESVSLTAEVKSTDSHAILHPRRNLEEEYLEYEAKIIAAFSVVDNMRKQFYAERGQISSKENPKVEELFSKIDKLHKEFDSVERPSLEIENPSKEVGIKEQGVFSGEKLEESSTTSTKQSGNEGQTKADDPEAVPDKPEQQQPLDAEAELAKLESEFGKVNQDYSAEEIGEWEFDELERELGRSGETVK